MGINVENLASNITQALKDYNENIAEETKKIVNKLSKKAVDKIKQKSPVRTGDYKKGWTSSKSYENRTEKRNTIHNKTDYQLTHLLEYGHVGRNGRRVRAIPHIKTVETEIIAEFENEIERVANNN